MKRRTFLQTASAALASGAELPDKLVVLTLDDAVKSHRTFAAPLLNELGFGATFFITHLWMADTEHSLSWGDVAELHKLGFEIGNHSWTHADFSSPRNVSRLAGELALIENELKKVAVPKPVSFAYSGNGFGPEALPVLRDCGYRFARRGVSPEAEYGTLQTGPLFNPHIHDPLLIPTTGDANPKWDPQHFTKVMSLAKPGQAIVLQFHGVPDEKHPWVNTPAENFRSYMRHLKDGGYKVVSLRALGEYLDISHPPADPAAKTRFPVRSTPLQLPVETEQSRRDPAYWLQNMVGSHRYSEQEAASVLLWPQEQVRAEVKAIARESTKTATVPVRPYPGGRPLRIGFREGAIDPMRGTKASVFLPWAPEEYVVIDVPEAIFSNLGLLFLAHTHIPTIWNDQNKVIENADWERLPGGALRSQWNLPNGVSFGSSIQPQAKEIRMDLWLRNGTPEALSKLRTQICVLLKGAGSLNAQTAGNKVFGKTVAAVRSSDDKRWVLTEWERCGRTWGNPQCPCFHSDPVLPDCAPGETVRVAGRLWFHEGERPAVL